MTRRFAVWILLLVVFVALVAGAAASGRDATGSLSTPITRHGVTYSGTVVQEGDGDSRVAMIPVYNALVDGATPADGSATGAEDIVRMIDAIREDEDSWDGVILELDTPGGSVLASEEITEALERLREDTELPVLAWMRGTAASAGYYISASADRIVAAPSTFTGSIGVILQYYVVDELAKDVGVEAVTIKSGELKDIGNPLRQATAEERALFQRIIDESYDQFVDVVAEGRDMDESRVRELADGRIYTGRQAEELGLVDELGLRSTAYEEMAKLIDEGDDGEELDIVRFSRSFSVLQSLLAAQGPDLDAVAAAKFVGGVLRGSGGGAASAELEAAGATRLGTGFARLEYRAELG